MANIYLQNTAFCVAGFLLGISVSMTIANGDASQDKVAAPQDILAQSGRVRLRVAPSAADSKALKAQTASVSKDAFGVPEEQFEPNQDIEASVEPQSSVPDAASVPDKAAAAAFETEQTPVAIVEPALEAVPETMVQETIETQASPARSEPNTAAAPKTSPSPSPNIEYGLHLASLSRPENIAEMIESLEDAFTDELSDRSFYEMQGENSITGRKFIRLVSAGYESRDDALSQCDRLKAQGQYCAVVQIQR